MTFDHMETDESRKLPSVPSATPIYATPSSNYAVTLSAKVVYRTLSPTDQENARPVVKHSATQITCPLSWLEPLVQTLPHKNIIRRPSSTFLPFYDTLFSYSSLHPYLLLESDFSCSWNRHIASVVQQESYGFKRLVDTHFLSMPYSRVN